MGVGLLAFLVSRADLTGLRDRVFTLDPLFLILVLFLPHVGIWLSSVKWQALLRTVGVEAPLRRVFGLYMVGTFFNNFFPTMVGGDLVKVYQLSREARNAPAVVAATFMERFIGFAALVSLLPLVLLREEILEKTPMLIWAVGLAIAGYLVALLIVFSKFRLSSVEAKPSARVFSRFVGLIQKTRNQLQFFRQSGSVLAASYVISIGFYLVAAAASWSAVRSTGADVGYGYLISVVPAILLVALIPISLNGLGVTESGYVLALTLAGVSTLDALTAALLLRGRLLITALLGGIIFLFYRAEPGRLMGDSLEER